MAATRLIAMHQNKGKTAAQCLKDRTDYAKNDEKTEHGELVTAYACNKETVDQEFLLAKQEYYRNTGRKPRGDILAWQIRQSFKPGEITAEEANRIGYDTAMRFTKGQHAFIVATHTDRAHIHNHIIFNAVNLDCDRKFRDSWFIALGLQRLSDVICLEHCLSVIKPRKPGERDNRSPYQRTFLRDAIRENIDRILSEHPKDFQAFLDELQKSGYEIRKGKHVSVRGGEQKRFIRLRSLGEGYTEEELQKKIADAISVDDSGEKIGKDKQHQTVGQRHENRKQLRREFDLLIDINRKMQEGKGKGYEHWAKIFNVKQISKALLFLQEHGIRDYGSLESKAAESAARFHELNNAIKEKEARLTEIGSLRMQIINYAKTRETYEAYRRSGYSRKFLEEHRQEIMLHKAAKETFDRMPGKTIPKRKDLSAEYAAVLAMKKKLYEEYRQTKKEMMDYQIAKQDIDRFLKTDEEQRSQENEKKKSQER